MKDAAFRRGALLTAGGSRLERKGYFYAPTVLADVPDAAAIMTVEPFGPVTPIASFRDTAAVIGRANDTAYGLAAYVFSATSIRRRGSPPRSMLA